MCKSKKSQTVGGLCSLLTGVLTRPLVVAAIGGALFWPIFRLTSCLVGGGSLKGYQADALGVDALGAALGAPLGMQIALRVASRWHAEEPTARALAVLGLLWGLWLGPCIVRIIILVIRNLLA